MRSGIFRWCVIGVVSLIFLVPDFSYGWGGKIHRKITSDAYFIMPKAFREFLGETKGKMGGPHFQALLDASCEPDTVLKDFKNHVYHIQGYDLGNGPFHVGTLVKEIIADVQAKVPKAKIIQKLGWLSHYCADLVQPLHTGVATWEGIEEKSYHSALEKDADANMYTYGVYFDGASPIQRITARMIYEALWANQYYAALEIAYTKGGKYHDAGNILAICYSRAVNNVVDMWYTVWKSIGGKINPRVDLKPRYYPPCNSGRAVISPLPK